MGLRKILREELLKENSEKPIGAMMTAQGSQYLLFKKSDGSFYTIRNKTLHQGHDPKDVGIKPASDITIFIADHYLSKAQMIYTQGFAKRSFLPNAKAKTLTIHDVMQNGRIINTVIPFSYTPELGVSPLEFSSNSVHLGNKITKIKWY